jgi:hypothetical protein
MKSRVIVAMGCLVVGLPLSSTRADAGADPPEVVAWGDCLRASADKYVSQEVPVETIASAAFGACKVQDQAVYQLRLKRSFGTRLLMGPANREDQKLAREAQDRMHADVRDQLIAYLLEQRASRPPARDQK